MSSHIEIKAGAFTYRLNIPASIPDNIVQEMFTRYADSLGATEETTPAERGRLITMNWARDVQSVSIESLAAELNDPLKEALSLELAANEQTARDRYTFSV